MEKTIEQLLELTSGSTPRESSGPVYPVAVCPTPAYSSHVQQSSPPTSKQWRHPLPRDFLEVPPIIYEIIQQQMQEDEYVREAIGSVTPRPRTRTDSKTGSILTLIYIILFVVRVTSTSATNTPMNGIQEEGFFSRLSKLGTDMKDRLKAAFSKSSKPYASRSRYQYI